MEGTLTVEYGPQSRQLGVIDRLTAEGRFAVTLP